MIRGMEPGARIEKERVLEKYRRSGRYVVVFEEASGARCTVGCIGLPRAVWGRYDVGDEIEIVYLPDSEEPFHRDGIYASDGNFIFDYVLLAVEIIFSAFALCFAVVATWELLKPVAEFREEDPQDEGVGGDTEDALASDWGLLDDGDSLLTQGSLFGDTELVAPVLDQEIETDTVAGVVDETPERPASTVDLSALVGASYKGFELLVLLLGSLGLTFAVDAVGRSDPLATCFGLSGALCLLGMLCVRFRLVAAVRLAGRALKACFLIDMIVFLQGGLQRPGGTDALEILGAGFFFFMFTIVPGSSLSSLASRLDAAKGILGRDSLSIRHKPFGFTSLLAIASSPPALLVLLGGLAGLLGMFVGLEENHANGKAFAVCVALVTFVWHSAKRISSLGSLRRLFPRRRFTLYLRPFADDGARVRTFERPDFYTWAYFSSAFEEAIVNALHPYGRVYALLGERFTPPGALRVRLGKGLPWREEVKRLIDDASFIVVVAGTSEGVMWEIDQIFKSEAQDKTIFVFPPKVERKFEEKIEANQLRIAALRSSYHASHGELPALPLEAYGQKAIGASFSSDGICWYTASEPHVSGFALAISYMISRLECRGWE